MTWEPPWVATGAPPQIKAMMDLENDMGQLAIEAVNTQISLYNAVVTSAQQQRSSGIPSLFDTVVDRIGDILSEDPATALDAISGLAAPIAQRVKWKWERLSYAVLRAGRKIGDGTEQQHSWAITELNLLDVDGWIAENEKWLRLNAGSDEWKGSLVNFFTNADVIFDDSTLDDSSRKIIRPALPGLHLLDQLRLPEVHIQPSLAAFQEKFGQLTNNQLQGLDWSNIFVAGGMVLGTMLTVGDKQPALLESSDIDVFIYGLRPPEANDKIEHLFTIFKSNLPPSAEVLVVRNSKTITFFSQFPLRRLQVVLKIVKTPLDVLLSFDLDICAMGFDGEDVWMLPRAARALEAGYNVFTMDMIQGHYLAERRATHDTRVFKYAYKGYGIRILPSYIGSLPEGVLEKKIQRGREWVKQVVQAGMQSGHFDISNNLPHVSHFKIDFCNRKPFESGSCLIGYELFCRHVALWEAEQGGEIKISDTWSSTTYEARGTAYNDSPRYKWDASFTLKGLRNHLQLFNREQVWEFLMFAEDKFGPRDWHDLEYSMPRSTFSDDLHHVLSPQGHIIIPVIVPLRFFKFANQMVAEALKENGLPSIEPLALFEYRSDSTELNDQAKDDEDDIEVLWTIDQITMWQQLDRRIDEIHEVLWSLRHANSVPWGEATGRMNLFRSQISQRSIRKSPADELDSFARWVARAPTYRDEEDLQVTFGSTFQWKESESSDEK